MKFIETKSDLKEVKKTLKAATYVVDSTMLGTTNVYFMFSDNNLSFDFWTNDSEAERLKHACIMAYWNEDNGNVTIYNTSKDFRAKLFGTGKHHSGRILYIQRNYDMFTIVYNKDNAEGKHCFRMTATEDTVMIQVILMLISELFPTIDSVVADNAIAILIQRNHQKEEADGRK